MRFLSLSLAAGALACHRPRLAQTPESTCAAKAKTKTVERAGNGEIDMALRDPCLRQRRAA